MNESKAIKKKSWKQRFKWMTYGLLLMVVVFSGACFYLYHAEDVIWEERQAYLLEHDDKVLLVLADQLAGQILKKSNPFHGQNYVRRPERHTAGPQQIVVKLEQLNAYLKTRLDQFLNRYLKVRIPDVVLGQMLAVNSDGQLELKFKYKNDEIDQVVTLVFEIDITEEGEGKLRCVGARAGRLPVPLWVLTKSFKKHFEPKYGMEQLVDGNDGQMGMLFEPVLKARRYRDQVRVTGVVFGKKGITIDYYFEPVK